MRFVSISYNVSKELVHLIVYSDSADNFIHLRYFIRLLLFGTYVSSFQLCELLFILFFNRYIVDMFDILNVYWDAFSWVQMPSFLLMNYR